MLYYIAGSIPIEAFSTDTTSNSGIRWAVLDFDPTNSTSDTIVLRIATSLISAEQAMVAHAAEVEGMVCLCYRGVPKI